LQSWVEDTGIDGVNLVYAMTPESFSDFTKFVVSKLQSRDPHQTEYRSGTLREKSFGAGPRLAAPHPAAGYRINP
jgi:hypothetical protein